MGSVSEFWLSWTENHDYFRNLGSVVVCASQKHGRDFLRFPILLAVMISLHFPNYYYHYPSSLNLVLHLFFALTKIMKEAVIS